MTRLSLDISPCPNDTFMFDALVNGRIDTRGIGFDVRFADIEELNRRAIEGCGENACGATVSKVSYAILPLIHTKYEVLDSGSALGHGNGPLLVARPGIRVDTPGIRVAVPGLHTTANLLLRRLHPELADVHPLLFSRIASAVASGEFDAGVLIHEGRFTYRDHGLELVADLGELWEAATVSVDTVSSGSVYGSHRGLPLPLGAIVVIRSLPPQIRRTVEELVRASVRYAMDHPEASREFVRGHAQEMDERVVESHIKLFVNDYSLSLGEEGRRAVKELTGVRI